MEATDKQFNDFIIGEILRILGITIDDYAKLLFEAGIKAQENNNKYKSYFTETGAFWDCFKYRASFVNLTLIAQDKFMNSVRGEAPITMDVSKYIEMITQNFELPKRAINLINKQYRIDFENSQIVENGYLKPSKQQRRTRTPRKANNQTAINLNTI